MAIVTFQLKGILRKQFVPSHGAAQTQRGSLFVDSHLPPLWHLKLEHGSYSMIQK